MSTSQEDAEARVAALNEGEKLGKRLHNLWTAALEELGSQGVAWQSADDVHRAAMVRTALRIRAECVGPFKELEKAVEAIRRDAFCRTGDSRGGWLYLIKEELIEKLCEVLHALSVPAPSAPDEPPKEGKQEAALDNCPLCLIGKKGASGWCKGCYEKVWLVKCQKCGWDCHLADYGYECNKVGDIISIVCPGCKTAWWKIVGESFGVAAIRAKLEGK